MYDVLKWNETLPKITDSKQTYCGCLSTLKKHTQILRFRVYRELGTSKNVVNLHENKNLSGDLTQLVRMSIVIFCIKVGQEMEHDMNWYWETSLYWKVSKQVINPVENKGNRGSQKLSRRERNMEIITRVNFCTSKARRSLF